MAPETESSLPSSEREATPELFSLLNRVINLLFILIAPLVVSILGLIATLVWVTLTSGSSPAPNQFSNRSESAQVIQTQINSLLPPLETLTQTVWRFIAPLLAFCVVLAIVKWVFLTKGLESFRARLLQTNWDVTSIIAVMVLFTICLIPLMGNTIPEPIANIGLVVVGFYFGSKWSGQPRG